MKKGKTVSVVSIIVVIVLIIIGIVVFHNRGYRPAKDFDVKYTGKNGHPKTRGEGNVPEKISQVINKKIGMPNKVATKLNQDNNTNYGLSHHTEQNYFLDAGEVLETGKAYRLLHSDSSLATSDPDIKPKLKKYIRYMDDIYIYASPKRSARSIISNFKNHTPHKSTAKFWNNVWFWDGRVKNGQKVNYVFYVKKDKGNPIKTSATTVKVHGLH